MLFTEKNQSNVLLRREKLEKVLSLLDLYEQFISKHDCDINHEGSAGAMEVSGLIECFMESEKKTDFYAILAILEMETLSLTVKFSKKIHIQEQLYKS